ncbi:unnamed protein product [Heterobilharzia americana]|nr:unnamed protein product [Heterobilharzia americana]
MQAHGIDQEKAIRSILWAHSYKSLFERYQGLYQRNCQLPGENRTSNRCFSIFQQTRNTILITVCKALTV